MSCSLFSFILTIVTIDINSIKDNFNNKLPIKLSGRFEIFLGFSLFMLWMGKIAPSLINGTVPIGLEHYTTLVIQAMDLGIVVPLSIMSGILLMKINTYSISKDMFFYSQNIHINME
jgi:hypothetical protein